jgi:hypothetical protein
VSLFARIRALFTPTQGASMSDQFNVTAAITPANPTTGDHLTLTISGDDVHTVTQPGTIGPLTLSLQAADGATTSIKVASVPFNLVTTTHESVKITGVTDPSGRVWMPAADGLTATATA